MAAERRAVSAITELQTRRRQEDSPGWLFENTLNSRNLWSNGLKPPLLVAEQFAFEKRLGEGPNDAEEFCMTHRGHRSCGDLCVRSASPVPETLDPMIG